MASETTSVRLSEGDRDLIEQYADDEGIGESTALKRAARRGFRSLGYDVAGVRASGDTRLQRLSSEAWRACLWGAGALVIADVAGSVGFSVEAAGLLIAALVFQLVAFNEPTVTERVRRGGAVTDGGETDD